MEVGLAIVYHDPRGRLHKQIQKVLPAIRPMFKGIAVYASAAVQEEALSYFAQVGAKVQQDGTTRGGKIGLARRKAVMMALETKCTHILYCDSDRLFHWAETYPAELEQVIGQIVKYDLTILGRTQRAFETHPRPQRETEAIVNRVFALASQKNWDVTVGARGLSRRAAGAILNGCPDEKLSTDVSWPLFLQRLGGYTFGYLEVEGLEFETADRFLDEVAAAGGMQAWIARIENDPWQWAHRLEMARTEIKAMLPYLPQEV